MHVPAKTIPAAPATASPQMQHYIASTSPDVQEAEANEPTTRDGWVEWFEGSSDNDVRPVDGMLKRYDVTAKESQTAGIHCYSLTPREIPSRNANRLLIHVHGGAYMAGIGMAGLPEGILWAHYARMRVLSIDYRMPPRYPFPAAIDDIVAVWTELSKSHNPKAIALVGASAGGNGVLATVQRLIHEGRPLPGAIAPGTPWADLSGAGDTRATHAAIDVTAAPRALAAAAEMYANGISLKDPRISPVYGSFEDFPPAALVSGSRDLLLSDTVRVNEKMLEAGIETNLLVLEGERHADYIEAAIWENTKQPETKLAFETSAKFLDKHLAH